MKIIDLLNKIANGKIPKKIVYDEMYFTYDDERKNYYAYDDSEIDWKYTVMEYINDEIEILEDKPKEEKKIPEKICTNRIINTKDILEFEMIQNKINAEYTYAINEIIDCLDYFKSKGDE